MGLPAAGTAYAGSGLCLDQTGAMTTQGVQFDQWTCKTGTGTNQDFATR